MRSQLDFSLLVLTSCIVVLTLDPANHSIADRAATPSELSSQSDRVEQVEHSDIRPSPGAPIITGTEERLLRLLQRKGDKGLNWG
ncbi:MAG: hypothetical protein SW833_20655 [Cyanobacteriota bacterium]|nr:hypothetical protein [Cyanobacteriota bacterium]